MELARQAVAIPDVAVEAELSAQRRELLLQADKVLGYKRGINILLIGQAATAARLASVAKVKDVLAAAGIEPFSPEAVIKYKRQHRRKAQRRYAVRNYANSTPGEVFMNIGAIIFGVSSFFCLVFSIMRATGDMKHSLFSGPTLIPFLTALVGGAFWIGTAMIRNATKREHLTFEWSSVSLPYYERDLPDFALAHGIVIKQHLPDADLRIEQLTAETHRRPTIDPDPFLVLRHGGVDYYIDVWDERDFERKNS